MARSGEARRRVGLTALAFSVGLGALAMVQVVLRPPPTAVETRQASTGPQPVIDLVVPLPSASSALANGEGGVWVVVSEVDLADGCSGAFLRLDPATGSLSDPVSTNGTPTEVAVGDGSVWIAQRGCSGEEVAGEVLRYHPATWELIARVSVAEQGAASALSFGPSELWGTWGGEVVAVDPASNSVVSRIPADGRLRDVQATEAAAWVLGTGPEEGSLVRIDPGTEAVVATVSLGESPGGLAVTGTAVWTGALGGLARIDAVTNDMSEVGTRGVGPTPIGADETGIWFVAADPAGGWMLSHLDEVSEEVDASIPLPDFPVDGTLDVAARTIWLLDYAGEAERNALRISY
jgi:hypothetical protein